MHGHTLKEVSLKCLLYLNLTPDLKYNLYIHTTASDAGKMDGSFSHSSKYTTPDAMLY